MCCRRLLLECDTPCILTYWSTYTGRQTYEVTRLEYLCTANNIVRRDNNFGHMCVCHFRQYKHLSRGPLHELIAGPYMCNGFLRNRTDIIISYSFLDSVAPTAPRKTPLIITAKICCEDFLSLARLTTSLTPHLVRSGSAHNSTGH
jgi:hypothetical protein